MVQLLHPYMTTKKTIAFLCDPMDGSLPGSTVHGVFQARILEWGCHFLLQGIFPAEGSNLGLLHCRQTLYRPSHSECESWTKKEDECQRIAAFELWHWRRLLRVPWTGWRSNQSILKEISPEYSLEGLILKLKLQYFGHLMRRADSFEKTLMLGKIEGRRGRG